MSLLCLTNCATPASHDQPGAHPEPEERTDNSQTPNLLSDDPTSPRTLQLIASRTKRIRNQKITMKSLMKPSDFEIDLEPEPPQPAAYPAALFVDNNTPRSTSLYPSSLSQSPDTYPFSAAPPQPVAPYFGNTDTRILADTPPPPSSPRELGDSDERWAGGAFENSPAPSSIPIPRFQHKTPVPPVTPQNVPFYASPPLPSAYPWPGMPFGMPGFQYPVPPSNNPRVLNQ